MSGLARRTGYAANLALFLCALFVIAITVNVLAHRANLRLKIDATKTRAYSLSEQTERLLVELQGNWTIALVLVEDAADQATHQQIDEVLRRYAEATPAIEVLRVDPTDPGAVTVYESLLARLRKLEADRIEAYETALDEGARAFKALLVFAQQQSGQLEQALTQLPAGDVDRPGVEERLGMLGVLAREGGQVLDAVHTARVVNETQPIPDYETARSILGQALQQFGDELYEMARLSRGWRERADVSPVLARYGTEVQRTYQDMAQRLATTADPLLTLPPLEIASIGRQLRGGEALLVIGPQRAAVVPSAQLFPKISREAHDGTVSFDRRFRGEQVISAAVRALLVEQMPLVVFVHAEDRSLLRPNDQHADVVGVASLMETNRFRTAEWSVGQTERPVPVDGQPVVWIVVPSAARRGLEPSAKELAHIRAVETLIDEGASVLLSVYPSLLPRYRQRDPWQAVAAPFLLRPDTGQAVYEAVETPDRARVYQHAQTVMQFPGDHAISQAADGQQATFPLPVPIVLAETEDDGIERHVLVEVPPSPRRWLEADWARKMNSGEDVISGDPFPEPVPIVVAAERRNPAGDGRQRFVVVGSGAWMLSYVADAVSSLGGGRVALTNPGNQELLLAATAWLAGYDELIAPTAVSRQVARLEGIDRRAAWQWGAVAMLGTPLGCIAFGFMVWLVRRV